MIELVIDERRRSLSRGGFEVGRVLPFAKRRMVGHFKAAAPAEGVRPLQRCGFWRALA